MRERGYVEIGTKGNISEERLEKASEEELGGRGCPMAEGK